MLISKALKYIQVLSLDVSIGACAGTLFVGHFLGIKMWWSVIVCLGLTVWLIYTLDHLLDARRIPHIAHTERHRFHQKYFKEMKFLWFFVLLLTGSIVLFIPIRTFIWGFGLMFIVFIYFYFQNFIIQNRNAYKEPIAAFLYVSGIFLGPLSVYHGNLPAELFFLFTQYFIVAFFNMILFSFMEVESDKKDKQSSITLVFGVNKTKQLSKILIVIFITSCLTGMVLFSRNYNFIISEVIIISMGITLFGIFWKHSFFRFEERYRLFGDLVFLYPLLIIIYL